MIPTQQAHKKKMLYHQYFFLLPAILLLLPSSSIALNIPHTQSLSSNLSVPLPANQSSVISDQLHCVELKNPFSDRAKYMDCKAAIRQLPSIPEKAAFHNYGPDDPFKLPVEKTVRTCTVVVQLFSGSFAVPGSWGVINVKIQELNLQCLRTILPTYRGGWGTYGRDERIAFSLGYSDTLGALGGGANITIV